MSVNKFQENIINIYGNEGKKWLLHLPNLIMKFEEKYKLTNLKTIDNLSYNYVLSGFQSVQPIVLKIGLDRDSLKWESQALKAFAGFGVAKLIAEEEGMLLLEQAIPGTSLSSIAQDHEAIEIASRCLKRVHQAPIPSVHQLPHIKDWLIALDANNANIPSNHLQKARTLRDKLLTTSGTEVLLHGDLHHDNILQHNNEWLLIDPKGLLGEAAYEVGAFIRNPIPKLLAGGNTLAIIKRQISYFSGILEVPEQRLVDWCFVQAVLAWDWTVEDKGDETYFKQLVDVFNNC
jgi:streptomycin 6-kinase